VPNKRIAELTARFFENEILHKQQRSVSCDIVGPIGNSVIVETMASRKLRSAPGDVSTDKKLKTQLGVCKRMVKEVQSYEKEVVVNEARVQKMRDEGKDPYDIRKQEEVLQESYMMIPDSKARLETTLADLEACMDECKDDTTVDAAMIDEAKALIVNSRLTA